MPIISVEIMKIINERERYNTREQRNKDKKTREGKNYSEGMRAKSFCCAFKLCFLQFICKASLIFMWDLSQEECDLLKAGLYFFNPTR